MMIIDNSTVENMRNELELFFKDHCLIDHLNLMMLFQINLQKTIFDLFFLDYEFEMEYELGTLIDEEYSMGFKAFWAKEIR